MRILSVHAHFDDFEFTAGGTFEMWRRLGLEDFRARVLVCTDGAAGHQFRTRTETAEVRLAEQLESARVGGYEFELLRLPGGGAVPEGFILDRAFLAALWRSIREFEPDYLFCPPIPQDPLMGVHTDHLSVAEAVRRLGYLINVPHAFSDIYPTDERHSESLRTPVILSGYDGYMVGANSHDLAVDVEEAVDCIAQMSFCHRSQLCEWLPWVGRHTMKAPADLGEWREILKERMRRQRLDLEASGERGLEFFTVTAWGAVPTLDQLLADFPSLSKESSRLEALGKKLARWGVL